MKRLVLSTTVAFALVAAPSVHGATVQPERATVRSLPVGVTASLLSGIAARADAVIVGARFEQHRGGGMRARGGGGAIVGRAAPRSGAPFGRGVFVRPFFPSPFFFGGFGLGFAYDPFFWGWGYPFGWGYPYWGAPYYGYGNGYGYQTRGAYRHYGAVKLDVKPRDAEVYVDGYYMGQVRDFNGLGHHLDLDSGDHKVEIRAPGYQPLDLNLKIMPGRTVNYRGELRK